MNDKSSYFENITSIIEELNGGALDGFIRKFVDEIMVSKIEENRHNIKLDIS